MLLLFGSKCVYDYAYRCRLWVFFIFICNSYVNMSLPSCYNVLFSSSFSFHDIIIVLLVIYLLTHRKNNPNAHIEVGAKERRIKENLQKIKNPLNGCRVPCLMCVKKNNIIFMFHVCNARQTFPSDCTTTGWMRKIATKQLKTIVFLLLFSNVACQTLIIL